MWLYWFLGALILVSLGLFMAALTLIYNYYYPIIEHNDYPLIVNLTISWVAFYLFMIVMGIYLSKVSDETPAARLAGFIMLVLFTLTTLSLLMATVIEIAQSPQFQDLYNPYVILITLIVVIFVMALFSIKVVKEWLKNKTRPS